MAKKFGLSGNILKVIGAISMLIDHIGYMIFPRVTILRIIGRLAFPIFSFMISEGCRYTKNKLKYLLQVLVLGIICLVVYYFVDGQWYFNVLITFAISITLIYIVQFIKSSDDIFIKLICTLIFAISVAIIYKLTDLYYIEYGFWGIMLPVFPALTELIVKPNDKYILALQPRFIVFSAGLVILSLFYAGVQYYSIATLILLAFYNGEKGFKLPKYFFYIFYPAHLVFVWLLSLIVLYVA